MVWKKRHGMKRRRALQFGYPEVLMLHCTGNSIGTMSLRRLQTFMKFSVSNTLAIQPNCKIIWSQILPRTYYRHMFSHVAAERSSSQDQQFFVRLCYCQKWGITIIVLPIKTVMTLLLGKLIFFPSDHPLLSYNPYKTIH